MSVPSSPNTPPNPPLDDSLPERLLPDSEENVCPIKRVTRSLDWVLFAVLTLAFFFFYFFTSRQGAFPGQSAYLLTQLTLTRPNTLFDHAIWQKLFQSFMALSSPQQSVHIATTLGIALSSLALGFTYLASTALFILFHDSTTPYFQTPKGARQAQIITRIGGFINTIALAFSAPFWVATARVGYHGFYFLWLIISVYLSLRYAAEKKPFLGILATFLYGLGMSQSSMLILFSPVFFLGVCYGLFRNGKLNAPFIFTSLATLLLGFALLFFYSLYQFVDTPGYKLLNFMGESQLLVSLFLALVKDIFYSLPKSGWFIIIGLVLLPWFSWILTAARTLNGERGRSLKILNLIILLVALAVLFDTRISPWAFFGFQPEQIILYWFSAMSFSYCAIALYFECLNRSVTPILDPLSPESTSRFSRFAPFANVTLRIVLILLALSLITFEGFHNIAHAKKSSTRFIHTYVHHLLNGLQNHTWLVTDGLFDDIILLHAAERTQEIHFVSLSTERYNLYKKITQSKLTSPRLKNALDISPFSLLQEWIETDSAVHQKLAFCLFPDFWTLGDYQVYPYGLSFVGLPAESTPPIPTEVAIQNYLTTLRAIQKDLERVPKHAEHRIQTLADIVRRRVSFIGNNLGYYLETHGNAADALTLYREVHAFDPLNVSTMLNLLSALKVANATDELTTLTQEIEDFRSQHYQPLHIWELSRTQGYVNSPEAFSILGWTWALSGQGTIGLKTLSQTLKTLSHVGSSEVLQAMAGIYARQGDTEQTASTLEAVIQAHPEDAESIIELARVKTAQGDTAAAESLLKRAQALSMPPAHLSREWANLKLAQGDLSGAEKLLVARLTAMPEDADARLSLCLTLTQIYEKAAQNEAESQTALRTRIEEEIALLESIPSARYFQASIARGHLRLVENDLHGARNDFIVANKSVPGHVPLLEIILQLDYRLKDTLHAKDHAIAILRIQSNHAFANYIMGSIALSLGNYESAHDYLERSHHVNPTLLTTADLAYAKLKLGHVNAAHTLAIKALEISEDFFEIWDTYGQINAALSHWEEAEKAFRKALRLQPQNPVVNLHLAQALFELNRVDESKALLKQLQAFESTFRGEDHRLYYKLWLESFGSSSPSQD